MYNPKHFEESRPEELQRIIQTYSLGALVVNGANGLDANHVPFLFDAAAGEHGKLQAHVARANSVWTDCKDGDEVLVIFTAGDAYISPNWYPSKHEQHRLVPTWNYQVVHVYGKLRIRDDEKFVRGVVAKLTNVHEKMVGEAKQWKMSDSSAEYISMMLSAIVGIEVEITRIVGKSKLSQNRENRDRLNAAHTLANRNEQAVSQAMLSAVPL
ncbi:MAG: FMN-binding negative transcriptional regulator [Anaerolineae bacterium]|nr:FMN-binding negative transcriptional regulator [Anaerolineae bacterium]